MKSHHLPLKRGIFFTLEVLLCLRIFLSWQIGSGPETLLVFCSGFTSRMHFYGHPSSTVSLHSCQKRLCPASSQLYYLGGAPRAEWIWLRTNLLGSEGFVWKMHSCSCWREEAGLHQFKFMLWSFGFFYFILRHVCPFPTLSTVLVGCCIRLSQHGPRSLWYVGPCCCLPHFSRSYCLCGCVENLKRMNTAWSK